MYALRSEPHAAFAIALLSFSAGRAAAEELPNECNVSYLVAAIGTLSNGCKDLRLTGQGTLLADSLIKRASAEPQECESKANGRIET